MRQTNFTLDQIFDLIGSPNQGYHKCLLINEVGEIFHEQKDEVSEKYLRSLLENENPGYRVISFCYLYSGESNEEKRNSLYEEFVSKQQNKGLVKKIDKMLTKK